MKQKCSNCCPHWRICILVSTTHTLSGLYKKKTPVFKIFNWFFLSLFCSLRRLIWDFVKPDWTINKGATLCWKMSIWAYIGPKRGFFQFPGRLMIFFSKPPFLMKKNKKKIMEQTFFIYLLPFFSNSLSKIDIFERGGNILEVIYRDI